MSTRKHIVFVETDVILPEAVLWTWEVFCHFTSVQFNVTDKKNGATIIIGYDLNSTIVLSREFWKGIEKNDFGTAYFNEQLVERNNDLLGTAFYFLNCLWERDPDKPRDKWGRSEFSSSIWREFGHARPFCRVNSIFEILAEQLDIEKPDMKSTVFLSHDIDAVYSAWKEDGMAALKKGRILAFARELFKKFKGKPSWFNFTDIARLESKMGLHSTFYWLAYKNEVAGVGKNADYDIHATRFKRVFDELSAMGMSHGIHKSLNSESLKEESNSFPIPVLSNRYHYLKFNFPELIKEMEESKLKMDASLGYAEVFGYRNGYSLPFVPFNLDKRRKSTFVEVPLCIMDATFSRYQKVTGDEAQKKILAFIEEHKENSCISVLWHNTHFTDLKYEGYGEVYSDILSVILERGLYAHNPSTIIGNVLNK